MGASWSSSAVAQPQPKEKKAISNLQRTWVKLGPSAVEGVGVFALRDIPEGVEVLRWDWLRYECVFISEEQLRAQVPREVFDQLRRIWHVDENGFVATPVDFSATLSYINFLNHSDQPNLRFSYSDGSYVSTRGVEMGEELCISYDRDYFPGYTDAMRVRESPNDASTARGNSAQQATSG